jgi:hypothetical protein
MLTAKISARYRKDALVDRLHWLVISGRLDLKQAQEEISAGWTAAYSKYVGEFLPTGSDRP